MSLSKKPEDKKPVSSTDNKTPIVNTDNKKPVPKAVLGMMFPKIKSPKVSVDYPDIRSISTSGSSVSIPKEIKPSYISSTATPSLTEKAKNDAAVEATFDNTIQFVGRNMGLGNIKRTDPAWSMIQSDILKQKSAGLLTATKDEEGNPVYGLKTSWIDDLKAGYDEHDFLKDKGFEYFNADRKSAIDKLNQSIVQERTTLLPKVENEYLKMMGGFVKPLEQTFVGGMAGVAAAASTSGPGVVATGIPAFIIGAGTTFALTAPDATAIRYGTSLEENYRIAKSKGMSDEDAYNAANNVAKVDAGGEIAMQALFAGMSGGVPRPNPTTSIFKESSKKALYETVKHEIKPIIGISSIAALGSGMSQIEAQKQGLQEDLSLKKALMSGSDLVTLHLIIRGLTGAVQIPKYVKASMANAMSNADKAAVKTIVKTGETNGVYPKGTMSKVNAVVEEFDTAKNASPKYEGDDVRQQVVSGLTQKLEAKLAEQKNLADIHKADLQPEIDDLTARIQQAKTAENPLSVEVREDGTKVIETQKTEQDATTETKGQVQESSTTGGVGEYQGVEGVKKQEAVQTDIGNRPIDGTEEVNRLTSSNAENLSKADVDKKFSILGDASRAGMIMHGGESTINEIDLSKQKGGNRGVHGHGMYFTDSPYKATDYGGNITFLDKSKLKILDTRGEVTDDLINRLKSSLEKLSEKERLVADVIIRDLESQKGKDIDTARKNIADKFQRMDVNPLFSKMISESGYDVMQNGYEYVIINAENANKAIVKNISERIYPEQKSAQPVQESVQPKLSDRIRSLKIDEAVLTGGERGAMQSNIAGVPIAAWNTSVELIAKAVEAGEDIAVAIDRVIKDLKSKGLEVNESEFKKQFETKDRTTPTEKAEAKMEGIPTAEYESLKRIAAKQFEQNSETDPAVIAKNLRTELDAKMDTSKISDDVFMQIAKDGVSEIKEYPFKPGTAKRMTREEAIDIFNKKMGRAETPKTSAYTTEQIVTNPKEVFKAMYTAATNVGKSIVDRFNIASDIIKDVMKNKGIVVDPKKVNKIVKSFITDKMDTETASEYFEDAMAEIENDAINGRTIGEVKKKIKDIKSAARQSYSTIAIQQGTSEIDFISPRKVSDPAKYLELAENYRKSITGEIPETANARQALKDYIASEKQAYENKQVEKHQKRYDRMIEKGEDPGITKEEYVQLMMNPETINQANEGILKFAESRAEVMREMTDVRQQMVTEAIDNGEINPELVNEAKEIASVDVKKIDPRNIKLFNNIIEDILNGEEPSKMGQIRSDIGAFNEVARVEGIRIQPMAKLKTAGFFSKIRKAITGWEGTTANFGKFGLTNTFFANVFNAKDAASLRRIITPFEININKVNELSKKVFEKIGSLYEGGPLGTIKSIAGAGDSRLNEINDMRIGFYGLLSQFDNMGDNLIKVKNSLISLSEMSANNYGEMSNYIKNYISVLESFGLIENIEYRTDYKNIIKDITLKDITKEELYSKLSDRERTVINEAINAYKDISYDLRKSVRDNYGDDLDISKADYLATTVFFKNFKDSYDIESSPYQLPTYIKNMKSSTSMERMTDMVEKTTKNNNEVSVHYDIRFLENFERKFRESAATAYTAENVIQINKIINNKEFKKIISGGDKYEYNYDVFSGKVKEYVESKKSPYNITTSQQAERSRIQKFFYGRLLNGYAQIAKQTAPALSYSTGANAVPYLKSLDVFASTFTSKDYKAAFDKFMSTTSLTDRLTGGLEIYHKAIADIDASNINKLRKDISDGMQSLFSKGFQYGDQFTTINALLTGYIRGLKEFGKIDSYNGFDFVKHINENGVDADAHAYAENFLARVNNESSAAGKAKVLKESDSKITRLLQSYNLNEWSNFVIDTGIISDKRATVADRKEAAARVLQYAASKGLFMAVSYGVYNLNTKIATKILNNYGVQMAEEDQESMKDKESADAMRYGLSIFADAALGGKSLVTSQGWKIALQLSTKYIQNKNREEKEKYGEVTKGTWLDPSWNFVYRNNSLGISGAYIDDIANIITNKGLSEDRIDTRVNSQKEAQSYLNAIGIGSIILAPTPDIANIAAQADKVMKSRELSKIDELVDLYQNSWDSNNSQEDRELYLKKFNALAEKYGLKDSYKMDILLPKSIKLKSKKELENAAKIFDTGGTKVSRTLSNISTKSGTTLYKIINNRYDGKTISNDRELLFLIQYGGISPEEYGIAYGMDKNGLPLPSPTEETYDAMFERYEQAYKIAPKIPSIKNFSRLNNMPQILDKQEFIAMVKDYEVKSTNMRIVNK